LRETALHIREKALACRTGGDYVVPLSQPYGPFARAMLEKQEYPNLIDASGKLKVPYDVVSNNLPYLMNVTIDTLFEKPTALSSVPVKFRASVADLAGVSTKYLIMPANSYGSDIAAIRLSQDGVRIARLVNETRLENLRFAAGSYVVQNSKSNRQKLSRIMEDIPVSVAGINSVEKNAQVAEIIEIKVKFIHSPEEK
jgi:hypothetical protein